MHWKMNMIFFVKSTHYKLSIQKGWSWRRGFQIDLRKKFTTKHGERKNGCSVKSDPKKKEIHTVHFRVLSCHVLKSCILHMKRYFHKRLLSCRVMSVLWQGIVFFGVRIIYPANGCRIWSGRDFFGTGFQSVLVGSNPPTAG